MAFKNGVVRRPGKTKVTRENSGSARFFVRTPRQHLDDKFTGRAIR
jgi:hypothetical protein